MSEAAAKTTGKAQGPTAERHPQRPVAGPESASAIDAVHALHRSAGNRAVTQALGHGAPLPRDVRAEMEARFGADFVDVRIHTDAQAHASATNLAAKAFTHGSDIVFNAHRFAPYQHEGRRLLAHELAHVVQQRRGGATPRLDPAASHEQAATRAADAVMGGSAPVAVAGGTAVGVAREEDGSLLGQLRRKVQTTIDKVPPEYRDKLQVVADVGADQVVSAVLSPIAPPMLTEGLGSALLHTAQASAAGEPSPSDHLKGFARDKTLENIGVVKGAVTQVTEAVDTVMWVGGEYTNQRDKVAEAVGGKKGSVGNTLVRGVIDTGATVLTGGTVVAAGATHDAAKDVGLVDKKTGQASITAPMSDKVNDAGEWLEDKMGGTPSDPMLFTPMEKGELKGAIATQVGLSLVGVEEAKVAIAALGLLGSVRGIVETVRADPNGYYKQPAFWSSILSAALSLVGMSNLRAGAKIIQIAIKGGTIMSVVPHVWQLYNDYNDPKLEQGDPEERRKVLSRDMQAVIRALADVVLMIAHAGAQGKAPPKGKGRPGADEGTGGKKQLSPAEVEEQNKLKSYRQLKDASDKAASAEAEAKDLKGKADDLKAKAQGAKDRAKLSADKAEEARQAAKAAADKFEEKQKIAEAKKNSPEKTREKARTQAANAKERMGTAQERVQEAEGVAGRQDARAKAAKQKADQARKDANKAQRTATKARAKVDKLTPAPTPEVTFDPSDPAFAPAPDAALPPNKEPWVWVKGGGKSKAARNAKGTYVREGEPGFGEGEGFLMPESEAVGEKGRGMAPAGGRPEPFTPVEKNGLRMESNNAGGDKGKTFISASAEDPQAVKVTSISADVVEANTYQSHLAQGEVGILRPLGSNVPGVDSITARIEFDAKGRPVKARIYLNDATSPTAGKGAKGTHEEWLKTLDKQLETLDFRDPKGPAEQPRAQQLKDVIKSAARNGEVYLRIVRAAPTPKGMSITMDPRETWRLFPKNVPLLRKPVRPPDKKDDEEEGQK